MDSSAKYDNPSPRLAANPISKLVFWWLVPLFKFGRKNDLEIKHLYNVSSNNVSRILGDNLERNWKRELDAALKTGRKPKLLTAIRKTFILSYMYYGGWTFFLFMVLRMLQPMIMGLLIWHFDPRAETTSSEAYVYASGLVILSILIAFIQHHANLGQLEIGMRVRIACCSLLYRKILRLSRSAANKTTGGQIVNLLSNDVARFEQLFVYLHFIWIMPLQGGLIAYLIWQSVQVASLAGVFLIIIQTIPLQGYIGKLTTRLREKIAVRTDERVRLMSEIITGIKVIKMYTWEKPFEKIVSMARCYEIKVLTLTSYLRGFNRATYVFTERTTLYFTIMAYVLMGNDISAVQVFTMAQYYNLMQFVIAILYPMAVSAGAEALVSVTRLEAFMLLDEKKKTQQQQQEQSVLNVGLRNNAERTPTIGVMIDRVSASWLDDSIANTLHDININVKPGKLCAIVGPVGGGKSSLLQLILGELEPNNGRVTVGGVVSYASQESWLFSGSVRNNILFGVPYDEARYRRVTKVCALTKDFLQLPQGDKTRVGERGTALSGGQRARINLARAIYRNADIYLLDDPLSAVDTHVGKQLFDECIMGYLSEKTRILVTHQVQFLNCCDAIVMLDNGVVSKQGSYEQFKNNELEINRSTMSNAETKEPIDVTTASIVELDDQSVLSTRRISRVDDTNDNDDDGGGEDIPETEELVTKGAMHKSIYWKYFSAGNNILILVGFIVIAILGQLGSSGADYWVAHWTKQREIQLRETMRDSNDSYPQLSNTTEFNSSRPDSSEIFDNSTDEIWSSSQYSTTPYNLTETWISDEIDDEKIINDDDSTFRLDTFTALWIYGGFIIASIVMTSARNIVFYKICMNSSKNLHNQMFARLLKAPMRFFDTNPSGRILNRFSKDVGSVDEILPSTMLDSIQIFAVIIGILSQILIIKYWTIIPIIIMAFFYGKIRNFYLATAQDIKRLEGIAKSPVFSHVNSSLTGLDTIRSAGKEHLVKNEFDGHQDLHTGAYFLAIATSSAFGLWLDFVTVTFVAVVTYSFVFGNDGTTYAGNVGLAVSQILILCGMMPHGMRQMAETIAQMTGVERILEFTELKGEGPFESEPESKPPAEWPTDGRIRFDRVYLRYADGDEPILKNLNISIEPGMKVGIVGRTGAGKSSLISALFNLAKLDGNILIDGIDIKKIGLTDLRSKISIIPQEPVLFSSTLRNNLDPFDKYADAVIWSAIEQVQLKIAVTNLDCVVDQGGSNFSAGQRQLVCLARAIVANNKILILDEATANVDPATDRLIQTAIRTTFKDCTVLTIAHRLNTVMDSDMVLVVDHGCAVEFDHPHILLQNSHGYFTNMVRETGQAMTDHLINISNKAYEDKRSASRS